MSAQPWKCTWANDHIKVSGGGSSHEWIYKLSSEPCCAKCGRPLLMETSCWEWYLHDTLALAERAFRLGHYYPSRNIQLQEKDDILTQHILALKENSDFAEPIGTAMALLIINKHRILLDSDFFIPVPSFGDKYNQSKALCQVISNVIKKLEGKDIPVQDALKKIKDDELHSYHYRMDMEEVADGMYTNNDIISVKNKNLTIVDDTLTTGITKSECSQILKQHGAAKIWVLVAGGNVS